MSGSRDAARQAAIHGDSTASLRMISPDRQGMQLEDDEGRVDPHHVASVAGWKKKT